MASFSVPLDRLALKIKAQLNNTVRQATHDLFSTIVARTPVDSGRARANWNVSQGVPDQSTSHSTDQGRAKGEIAKVLAYTSEGSVFMTNALPYIRLLEYGGYPKNPKSGTKTVNGFSAQAPFGMVRISVAEFNTTLERAVHASK